MKTYDQKTYVYTATGTIVDVTTSQSSAPHGGSITLYHLLVAIAGAEDAELLYFHASTFAKPHLPLPFLSVNQQVTVQYRNLQYRHCYDLHNEKKTTLGHALELLFLELDWNSTHYIETAKKIAAESEMPTPI